MPIELTKWFLDAVRKLPADEVGAVDEALATLAETFGRAHQHAGKSVRFLRKDVFELRASQSLRVIFVRAGSVLRVDFVGSHAAVADYLRNRR
jgi:hypothetical protein